MRLWPSLARIYIMNVISFFLKMGEPWHLFVYICSFQTEMLTEKTASFSVIRTRIVGVEGEFTDH